MTLGERIRAARTARGWSQAQLAAAVGQAQTTISSWETNRTTPRRGDVLRVAEQLGVSPADLEGAFQGVEEAAARWVAQPRSARGDADPDSIWLAVGRCLSAWESLEEQLAELFDALLDGRGAGYDAYIAVESSRVRQQMLKSCGERRLSSDWVEHMLDFRVLVRRVEELTPRRNEVAHSIVYETPLHGHYLVPSVMKRNKWHHEGDRAGAAKFQYVAADIDRFSVGMVDLERQARSLVGHLSSEPPHDTHIG